eukprot:TRINITY_DN17_c0_g1_i2.p1 TRINITY_DN17_c0_g1~~TRINITY_DN17_c0_g1_i2.p1  ORF type:complete len:156 (+),score=53.64 TRINITY_DN17_c0_g1_i2:72-470(+)
MDQTTPRVITEEELKQHTSRNDCWFVINGKVYDVTKYLDDHPGGPDVLVGQAGQDATEEFLHIGHGPKAKKKMEQYVIGTLEGAVVKEWSEESDSKSAGGESGSGAVSSFLFVLPILVILAAVLFKFYGEQK